MNNIIIYKVFNDCTVYIEEDVGYISCYFDNVTIEYSFDTSIQFTNCTFVDSKINQTGETCISLEFVHCNFVSTTLKSISDGNFEHCLFNGNGVLEGKWNNTNISMSVFVDYGMYCELNSCNFIFCKGYKLRTEKHFDKNFDIIPKEKPFYAYKKCKNNCILTLEILPDSLVSNAFGRKCRTNKAKVVDIYKHGSHLEEAISIHDEEFIYKKGQIVSVDNFDPNRWVECSTGIHFFLSLEEAENY